jgi:transposase
LADDVQRPAPWHQDCFHVGTLAQRIPFATGEAVGVGSIDQGHTGEQPAGNGQANGIRRELVSDHPAPQLPTTKHSPLLLPRHWVVERRFAWMARFRRLARDYERLPETLAGLHLLALAILLAHRFITCMLQYA